MAVQYWFYMATFYLTWLTYQDFKYSNKVDDRKNSFMYGVTITIYTHVVRQWWYIVFVIAAGFLFMYLGNKINQKLKQSIGEADIKTLAWILTGYGVINPFHFILFLMLFCLFTVVYLITKKALKIKKPIPFYPVILVTFVLNAWLFGYY